MIRKKVTKLWAEVVQAVVGVFGREDKVITLPNNHWSLNIPDNACVDAIEWARKQPSLETAWETCFCEFIDKEELMSDTIRGCQRKNIK